MIREAFFSVWFMVSSTPLIESFSNLNRARTSCYDGQSFAIVSGRRRSTDRITFQLWTRKVDRAGKERRTFDVTKQNQLGWFVIIFQRLTDYGKKKKRILTAHHDEIVIIFGGFHGLETLAQQRHLLLGERERVEQAHERQKLRPRAHLSEARPQIRVRADGRDRQVVRHFFPASHVRKREKKETGYIERKVLNEISIWRKEGVEFNPSDSSPLIVGKLSPRVN